MTGLTELAELLRTLRPVIRDGDYVYVTMSGPVPDRLEVDAVVREDEGTTVVLRREIADAGGLSYDFVAKWITLTVHSSLSAVGLTAALSTALGEAGVSCNVLAGYFHDHILVPVADVSTALRVLTELAAGALEG